MISTLNYNTGDDIHYMKAMLNYYNDVYYKYFKNVLHLADIVINFTGA